MSITLTLLLCACVAGISGESVEEPGVVLQGGRLFDTAAKAFRDNHGILIRDGRIESLLDEGEEIAGAELVTVDEDDHILPGFFDLHAHYNVNLFGRKRRDETVANPVIFLANGVTSTFPAGEFDPLDMMKMRERIDAGEQVGPRVFNSGPYFGRARRGWRRDMTAEEIAEEVDRWVERGARGFKAKSIGPDALKALIDAAHSHGLTVTGHLGSGFRGSVNPREAIEMGIDRIEHFLGGDLLPSNRPAYSSLQNATPDHEGFEEIAELFIENGVFFDATITAYGYYGHRKEGYDYWTDEGVFFTPYVTAYLKENKRRPFMEQFEKIYWAKRELTRAFFELGGQITLGTDHPSTGEYIAGFSVHRELETFVLAGIPSEEALGIATINGARALRVDERLGSLEPGKQADMMIVRGDPIEDIRRTRTVHTVYKAGVRYDCAELLKSVHGKLGPMSEEEASTW